MDTFQISVKTLPRHLLNLETDTSPLTSEQLKALLEQNNAVVRNPNSATFRLRDQTFIPHYALELSTSKYHFRENSNREILDIEYPKLLTGRGIVISNNINVVLNYMFNYWTINIPSNLLVVPFVKDGQQRRLYVGPGILLDSEGKVLCTVVYKKELITKLNLVDGFQKFKDFYSLYTRSSNQNLPVKLEDFMNENGLIIFSKEFAQKPEYQRFYKAIMNIFVNGLKYSLDNIYTDTIEKHIYNLPIDTTLDVNFKNMKEKLDFCRGVLKKSILT